MASADAVVAKPVVDALQAYYELLVDPRGVQRADLRGRRPHVSDRHEEPAGLRQDRHAVRRQLRHRRRAAAARAPVWPVRHAGTRTSNRATLVEFSQSPYAQATDAAGLAARGWLYVPAACSGDGAAGRCRLHVAFHGCKQGASYVNDAFVRQAGYLAAADAGGVVVLFPQVEPSFQPLNPNGCWDWWGYGSDDYATRAGPQIAAVKAMVDDLMGAGDRARAAP